MHSATIVWFKRDLRLLDNPALFHAANNPIIPLFILDENDPWYPGGASLWWLHKSLKSLKRSLTQHGLSLILRKGEPLKILHEIIKTNHIKGIYWNRCYDPYANKIEQQLKETFPSLECLGFNGTLLIKPSQMKTISGKFYQVFTPFWKALQQTHISPPHPIPNLQKSEIFLQSEDLDSWNLHPQNPDWSTEFTEWIPGEQSAQKKLERFLKTKINNYKLGRDFPNEDFTSKLSPHLHWGEISPRSIWHALRLSSSGETSEGELCFLKEIAWREFCYHLLYAFPSLPESALRPKFSLFHWENNTETFKAWTQGKTGYPIVDAGMRQLWHKGWMHNRVRMITASFLIKDLFISWEWGQKWFWDTLVDADLANNAANWQWVAGSGADAAPFFRIFNPVTQGQKFDPNGEYIKKWIPELKNLPSEYIHSPWLAPDSLLIKAGITLGKTYPHPIVDHKQAREKALFYFKNLPDLPLR